MSYTTNIKNEIAFLEKFKSETIAELSGFIRNNGYIDNNKLFLTTENKKIMENLVSTIKKIYEMYNHGYSMNNIRDYLNKKRFHLQKIKNGQYIRLDIF